MLFSGLLHCAALRFVLLAMTEKKACMIYHGLLHCAALRFVLLAMTKYCFITLCAFAITDSRHLDVSSLYFSPMMKKGLGMTKKECF
jgi:hypothetical protein